MSDIILGGHTYILESVEDTETPAHDYDSLLDINADSTIEEIDAFFERLETEWDSLPKEVQQKANDRIMAMADKLEKNYDEMKEYHNRNNEGEETSGSDVD